MKINIRTMIILTFSVIYSSLVFAQIQFTDSGQALGNNDSGVAALGDIDGDGDLDALVPNPDRSNKIWLNNGTGTFTESSQNVGQSTYVALADLDGDGDLDAFYAKNGANQVLLNDGNGNFSNTDDALGNLNSNHVVLGDLDGDSDLDAVITNWGNQPRTVWFNDGQGKFTDSGQRLNYNGYAQQAALGDLDQDGDLDIFTANNATANHQPIPNRVWFNDGHGIFEDSGQRLGNSVSYAVQLADLDKDGDLDAFVANSSHAGTDPVNKVWLNDGQGNFIDSGQRLGNTYSMDVTLTDLDDDIDLDAYISNWRTHDKVWLNDGKGNFLDSGLELGHTNAHMATLGDLDSDGDMDVFIANTTWYQDRGSNANRVLMNESKPLTNDPLVENQTNGRQFGSIQVALLQAQSGDTILVHPGVYQETLELTNKDVTLSSLDPNVPFYIGGTIVQGDPCAPVLTLAYNSEACKVVGITLRAGLTGITGIDTNAIVRNCRIMDNLTHGLELSQGSSPHLNHCLISANALTGITMLASNESPPRPCVPVIEDCIIVDNAHGNIVGGQPVITDSITMNQ